MSTELPRPLLRLQYAKAAEAYLRSLPPEHFMEALPQSIQREITLASFAVIHSLLPEFQHFNELLIQYPRGKGRKIGQVVPDNWAARSKHPLLVEGSFDLPLQPVRPFWVLEYISKGSERKDYNDSFRKYERDLEVPYLLLFYPEVQELTLFHHNGKKYVSVSANSAGRYAIPELEIEVGLLDGWMRYWYKGELVPLPAELQRQLKEARHQAEQAKQQAAEAKQQAAEAKQQAAEAKQQAAEAKQQAAEAKQQAAQERSHKERLLAQLRALGVVPQE
jgi:hypothetical protein